MEKRKLAKAVDALSTIIDEMHTEYFNFSERKREWYDLNLKLFRSGLESKEVFMGLVWKENQELQTCFSDDLFVIHRLLYDLESRYESFKKLENRFDEFVKNHPNSKPQGFKEYEVEFKESGIESNQTSNYFAYDEEFAKTLCVKEYQYGDNEIEIVNVKEIE